MNYNCWQPQKCHSHETNSGSIEPRILRSSDSLIKNAQKSKDAFEELVRRYQQDVLRSIRVFTQNKSDVEDLAQETWVKFYQAIGKPKPPYHLESSLFTIAQNTARDWLKSQQHRMSRLTNEINTWQLRDSAMLADLRQGLIEKVRNAVDSLSPKNRQVVYEFYICGYSTSQISQRLKVPVSTVHSRLKEARKQLREDFSSIVTASRIRGTC